MNKDTATALVCAFSQPLHERFYVEPWLPLEIKLRLERLRLAEMLAERRKENAGAANRTRTCDPVITNDVLYQLSYCG